MTLPSFEIPLEIPAPTNGPRLLIGPRSLFADRVRPDTEYIVLPPRTLKAMSGSFSATPDPAPTRDFRSRSERLLPWRRNRTEVPTPPSDRYVLDLRPRGLGNWSHALNQALPLALKVRRELAERGAATPALVLPTYGFVNVRAFFEELGFPTLVTNAAIVAPQAVYTETHPGLLRAYARAWVEPDLKALKEHWWADEEEPGQSIFLARKTTRALTNMDVISGMLEERGFRTIYAEDFSLKQQFTLMNTARRIVAIHGAALAPLLYRRREEGPLTFVELFSPGHVTPFYETLASRFGADYRAVRGIPERSMLPAAYEEKPDFSSFAAAHSLAPFAVDPASLEIALSPDPWGGLLAELEPYLRPRHEADGPGDEREPEAAGELSRA